jgi:hypothetical protein
MGSSKAIPKIDRRYICIADRDDIVLAAVVSSCLFELGVYVPLFLFPAVKHPQSDEEHRMTDAYMSNLLGSEASVLINNAWARMGGSEYAILAGLSEAQKSFLHLPAGVKVIEISALAEIPQKLGPFAASSRLELRCKSSDILEGLYLAHQAGKRLVVDESAEPLHAQAATSGKGIVTVEKVTDATPVVAVNYASSVDANILLVDPLPEGQGRHIPQLIQGWKERGESADLQRISDAVSARIGSTSFSDFEYATFFTKGLPYSLILKNLIPCSYVHLSLHPDLFVINNILFEEGGNIHAAIVFSPVFFADEETQWLSDFLSRKGFYVRALVGRDASLANFDFIAQHFPYQVLHICTHGGEVSGYEMEEQFVDRDGKSHTVEFDEVIGYTPVPDKQGLVEVHKKAFPRKLGVCPRIPFYSAEFA